MWSIQPGAAQARRDTPGGTALVYLLRDEFTTSESAPIASPRTCEPGPGTWTLVQTDGQFSITLDELVFPAQATPVFGDLYGVGSSLARLAGRALYARVLFNAANKDFWIGFNNDNTPANSNLAGIHAFRTGSTFGLSSNVDFVNDGTYSSALYYDMVVVMRSAGALFIAKGGAYSNWELIYVGNSGTAAGFPAFSNFDMSGKIAQIRVSDLPAPFNTDYGLITARAASAIANDTLTHTANGMVEAQRTFVTNDVYDLSVRGTDDNNRWIVRCDQAGGTVKLFEKNAGVETQRATASQTFPNTVTRRIAARFNGNTIYMDVDGAAKGSYGSASFQNTATIAKTNLAASDFVSWPRSLDSTARSVLDTPFFNLDTSGGTLISGDSKSTATYDYVPTLLASLQTATNRYWFERPAVRTYALGSINVNGLRAIYDSNPLDTSLRVTDVLLNIGVNDVTDSAISATWQTDMNAILDALHTAYPTARIGVMRIWKRTDGHATWAAKIATIDDTYIPACIAGRSYCYLGPDERVWLENGDNGTTLTDDGIHANVAGRAVEAAQWKAVMGY